MKKLKLSTTERILISDCASLGAEQFRSDKKNYQHLKRLATILLNELSKPKKFRFNELDKYLLGLSIAMTMQHSNQKDLLFAIGKTHFSDGFYCGTDRFI